ncbi:Glycosyl hydrolase catalytic core [Paracoccus laeviglucosivorans]|uniref:Glycosyl hydrolase catalytic core n=2 Tax=Paracoccus laeviglucosivorans TaxID=1197861 RepID=A0A521ECV6_9RHOB|nr:Glycosyl hydrolase catalytic core [Paracoccus laeviglucosivorans]
MAAMPAIALTPSRKKGFCGAEKLYRPELNCGWYYNWNLTPYPSVRIPFAPMIWGWNDARSPARLRSLSGRPPILFGFNEPDGRNQANMSVPDALDAWPNIENLADEIVSPSCVNARGRWMTNFMLQADKRGLKIDAIGVHSYSAPHAEQVIERLEETYRLYGRPLWVTEIAVADWRAANGGKRNRYDAKATLNFMSQITAFMDRTNWIKGYAWLASGTYGDGSPLSTSAFFDAQGRPSAAFRRYAAL